MNQYRSHLKWCVYFTPPTTNKTTPPINLGVWLFLLEVCIRYLTFEDTTHTYLIQFTQGQYELTPVAFSKKVPEYLVLIGKGISKEDYQCLEQ
ncbi:hypothetical protein SAKG22_25950 [Staphylococcus aureus]|nr:hypothetical protein SAKG03_25800 [Staphylococcus aureus]BBJ16740.1 hypothetical protein SAKG18_25910 [Staphylococcus aureus]BBJ19566.1 hypothetical protein SAKG22_25950 [Staphylococcus aureus]